MALNSSCTIISRSLTLRIPHSIGAAPRYLQQVTVRHESSSAYDKAANAGRECADAAKNAAEKVKNQTKSTADEAMEKSKDMGEKAKQSAQEAWETVKDTSQKIKDAVTGKVEQTKKIGKEEAERVRASMNKKQDA